MTNHGRSAPTRRQNTVRLLLLLLCGSAVQRISVALWYDDIADAFKAAAQDIGLGIRWGAAWHIPDIREWDQSMEAAMNSYVDLRRSEGRRPFIDAPHFEIA